MSTKAKTFRTVSPILDDTRLRELIAKTPKDYEGKLIYVPPDNNGKQLVALSKKAAANVAKSVSIIAQKLLQDK